MKQDSIFGTSRFIGEAVRVTFAKPLALEKTPPCPTKFHWGDEEMVIVEVLKEWRDYRRRGRAARSMQPQHAARAVKTGSWGVGRFYFRVKTTHGRVFDLYYDRAPKGSDKRKGAWFLYREFI